jgi:hypothetical protein
MARQLSAGLFARVKINFILILDPSLIIKPVECLRVRGKKVLRRWLKKFS